jgi:hypothetical protein
LTSGDFSRWLRYDANDNGVLYQQGRVLSDTDGTTQTRLVNDWQHLAGSDIIGRGVAAIPSVKPNSFKINSVTLDANNRIIVKVTPGWAWVNGRVVFLENGDVEITRTAEYLGPPFNDVPLEVTPGSKDAVILEVYQEAISAFQIPDHLLEPALGGPDTTELLHTSFAFRLLRLSQSDSCSTIADKLKDSGRGKLTVSLQKTPPVTGECPVDENYGYTGHTHNMYRIEVAEVNDGSQKFKWSQFNGGLVGRGNYTDATRSKIRIAHNMQAILWSGLTEFYLEIITYDQDAGVWKTRYGTIATMNSEKELDLSVVPVFGAVPPDDTNGIFFRLWNGIRDISEFTGDSPPSMLIDGIRLKFDAPTSLNYRPRDYWTFEVRAGGLKNLEILLQESESHGIQYERVPLSIIEWNNVPDSASIIEDCRVIFPPLIDQKDGAGCCCSITVGDGVSSHGNYDVLQDAINSMGDLGGEICLLEGVHHANAIIDNKKNLVIRACGNRTKVVNNEGKSPIITIQNNSTNILIEGIEFMADGAVAIRIDGNIGGIVKDIRVQNNTIRSTGIPKPIKALIEVINGTDVLIESNSLVFQESNVIETAIYVHGANIMAARNIISVAPTIILIRALSTRGMGDGIQIGNGSENITILGNKIDKVYGNGITLGDQPRHPDPDQPIPEGQASFIYRVQIDSNEISRTGLCGIGVPRLLSSDSTNGEPFQLTQMLALGTPVLDLKIYANRIFNCLQRTFDKSMIVEAALTLQGFPCRGFGGILLTWCENVIIKDNKIEDNGVRHVNPVSGIFIFFLSEGQIIQNYVFNNGPIGEGEFFNNGVRCGIAIIFSTGRNIIRGSFFGEDYAVRVHDNVVSQPAGRALLIGAQGAVSVLNNYFNSDIRDPVAVPLPNIPGGCVTIYIPGMGNSARYGERISAVSVPPITGGTIFECNQSRLGPGNSSILSHFILAGPDLCFGSNQVNCLNSEIRINTFLRSSTLRATDNRLFEPIVAAYRTLSLYSLGTLMNNTSNNQADHCIVALSASTSSVPVIRTPNQVLNPFSCNQLHDNIFSRASEVVRSYE